MGLAARLARARCRAEGRALASAGRAPAPPRCSAAGAGESAGRSLTALLAASEGASCGPKSHGLSARGRLRGGSSRPGAQARSAPGEPLRGRRAACQSARSKPLSDARGRPGRDKKAFTGVQRARRGRGEEEGPAASSDLAGGAPPAFKLGRRWRGGLFGKSPANSGFGSSAHRLA